MSATPRKGNIIPTLRYRDAPAALRWLCEAFGFTEHLVVPDGNGGLAHAQLVLGNGMIMIGSAREDAHGSRLRLPDQAGGVTQSAYIVVDEIDAHYERARAAGAEITLPIEDQDHGGRLYSALDPEGNLWNFGSYDPWAPVESGSES